MVRVGATDRDQLPARAMFGIEKCSLCNFAVILPRRASARLLVVRRLFPRGKGFMERVLEAFFFKLMFDNMETV